MYVPIKHVDFWLAFFISSILTVITHDWIMREYYFSFVVIKFLITLNPSENRTIKITFCQIPIMISHDNPYADLDYYGKNANLLYNNAFLIS